MRAREERRGRGGVAALAGTLALLLALPQLAAAASPLKVREVFPGSIAAGTGAELVELQMTADGQNDIDGQVLRFYNAAGAETSSFTIPSDVANGGSQRTVLLATAAASAVGAGSPDFTLSAVDRLSPAGGAVCFTGGTFLNDCVTWGSIPLQSELEGFPDPQSANAAAIADGFSLHRKITAGCSTYLDAPDDSGNSATDFTQAAPSPRANATAPTETRCAPDTQILTFPQNPTNQTEASFTYAETPSEPGASFECALDWTGTLESGDFSSCPEAGISYPGLLEGTHKFAVRASGEGGTDSSPDTHTWFVDLIAPETTIESTPPSPSSGFSATFTYDSSEPSSSFRCQLDAGAIQVCSASGKTYFGLASGTHVFRVWAKDNAGNEDPSPAEASFEVETDLGDFTPPDTTIVTSPSNPSPDTGASFTYSSSEAGSSFQCRLNGAAFASCPATGISYGNLANGTYTFEVRATDTAGNTDSVPASYTWKLAAAPPDTRITKAPAGNVRAGNRKKVAVSFSFTSSKAGSTFRCRLDLKGAYKPCKSPYRLKVEPGRHVFEVFATDTLGNEEGSPAFRIFRIQAKGGQRTFFVQSGRLLSSLSAEISPTTLPRKGLRPVTLSFASTFENLDGSDIPALRTMRMRLAKGGVVQSVGLPRCVAGRLAARTSEQALAACRSALVGKGTVTTALRFPEGVRLRATAKLLLFNAAGGLLMHIYTTNPLEGTFVVPLTLAKRGFGTELKATFPQIAAGYGQVTGFEMTLQRTYRFQGKRRSYLLANCPIPAGAGINRIAFELAKVDYRFEGGLRIANSSFNTCKVAG